MPGTAGRPLPASFGLDFAPGVRRPRPDVLIGGSPIRVIRLTPAGADTVSRWMAGGPIGPGRGRGSLAGRLVDSGIALPRPPSDLPAGPGVEVVVPVRDDPVGLSATLESLCATAPGVAITVVDDGSVPAVAAAGSTRVVRRPVAGGPAAARNTGWRACDSELIAFVDAGCVTDPGWLERLTAHFADPGLAAAAPRVRSLPSRRPGSAFDAYEAAHSPLDMGTEPAGVRPGGSVSYVPSAVLVVRRTALEEMGGFDEAMRYGEDVDALWRMAGAGWRLRYEPASAAGHPGRPDSRAWLRQRFHYGTSAAPLAARHGEVVAPVAASPWSSAVWALVVAGQPAAAAALALGSSAVLAVRAGRDRSTAGELFGLALRGHLRAAASLATGVRRAWFPPAAAAGTLVALRSPRRAAALAVAVAAGPGLLDWTRRRPPVPPPAWTALGLADDLSYQAGVWAGAVRQRSVRALLPRW